MYQVNICIIIFIIIICIMCTCKCVIIISLPTMCTFTCVLPLAAFPQDHHLLLINPRTVLSNFASKHCNRQQFTTATQGEARRREGKREGERGREGGRGRDISPGCCGGVNEHSDGRVLHQSEVTQLGGYYTFRSDNYTDDYIAKSTNYTCTL